jgi:hypothetical protein
MVVVMRWQVNESQGVVGGSRGLLAKHRVSDNVVPVKYFLGVLTRALRRARHFALVEGSAIPTKARS